MAKIDLPIYDAIIDGDENLGAFALSFVSFPATEISWQYFNKDEKPLMFSVESEEKRVVRGVFMLADVPLYRRSGDYEYYIKFSKETLRTIAERFLKNGFQNNIDLQHDGNMVQGVYLQEMFIKDVENGIDPKGFSTVPDGSLMCQYRVENDEVWQSVKDGTFTGFSLEGIFEINEESFQDPDYEECINLIKKINKKINNEK